MPSNQPPTALSSGDTAALTGGAGAQERRRTASLVGLAALLGVVLRLPGLGAPARPDEAGYLLVAAQAHAHGPFLYGDLWVDRPPLLLAVFRLAAVLGGVPALRLIGLLAAVLLVLAAAAAGRELGGRRGAVWAAFVAAALQASPLLSAPTVDGEVLALPLVLASMAVGLRALGRTGGVVPRLALAGALGGGAMLVKQNQADALVLLGVLVLARWGRGGQQDLRRTARLLGVLVAGAVVPLLAAVLWAQLWGPGASALTDAVVVFRQSAVSVIDQDRADNLHRARTMLLAAVRAGIVPLLAVGLLRRPQRLRPEGVAVAVTTAFGMASIAGGGSFWSHYLLELVPAVALTAALLAPAARFLACAAGALVTASACVVVISSGHGHGTGSGCGGQHSPTADAQVAAALRAHERPGDTAVLLYGGADRLAGTGVRPAYPYLWSLPVRVLDPQLQLLGEALRGPAAATWVLRGLPTNTWGLDRSGRVAARLALSYRPVAQVCGQQLLLLAGLDRPVH